MKNRNILYGYCYKDGIITVHEGEAKIVKGVCKAYLDGKSLLDIANGLNEQQIEYMPDVMGWNKARIMRMLEDIRYVGDERYPPIIEQETYDAIRKLKDSKNGQKAIDRKSDIFQLSLPVRCPNCNGVLKRRVDCRRDKASRWDCSNPNCKTVIGMVDDEMLSEITEVLNTAIANPEMITIPTEKEKEPSIELRKLNNEITRAFDSIQIDRNAVREMMIRYASMKYAELDTEVYRAQRLKNVFIDNQPMPSFSAAFLERTTNEIMLYTDGSIGLILENGQEIRKGATYADTRS